MRRVLRITAFFIIIYKAGWRLSNFKLSFSLFGIILVVHNYLLTPWNRVLIEKLTGLQLVKKFSAFYGTRMLITASRSSRDLFLSWGSSIQCIPPTYNFMNTHLNIIFPYTAGSPQWSLSFQASLSCTRLSPPPHALLVPPNSFVSILSPHNIGWGVQIIKLHII